MAAVPERRISLAGTAATPTPATGRPLWLESPLPPMTSASAEGRILLLDGPVGPEIAAVVMIAAGLVCSSALPTGHAVILAREIGIACVIGVCELASLRDATLIELVPDLGAVRATWT
jgi:phosphohistidine swiveling domain-containing protein